MSSNGFVAAGSVHTTMFASKRLRDEEESMYAQVASLTITPLKAVYVVSLMLPKEQSILRRSGSVGVSIYEEMVAQGLAGTHVELTIGIDGGDTKQHVPVDVVTCPATAPFYADDVLVVSVSRSDTLKGTALGRHVTNVRLTGCSKMTSTGPNVLEDCVSLTAVDMQGLATITYISPWFLFRCSGLATIDVSAFVCVTSIGSSFMVGCSSLTTIANMRAFASVRSIGSSFLYRCSSLASVDLSMFTSVTSFGSNFLCDCTSLTAIDMGAFSNVTSIGEGFLSGCTSLATIDMSALCNVTKVGSLVLNSCKSLTAIDLGVFSNVTSVGHSFMSDCTSLADVHLCPIGDAMVVVDWGMFEGCTSLTHTVAIKEWVGRSGV